MSGASPIIAATISEWAANLEAADIPQPVRSKLGLIALDSLGIMVSARNEDYIAAVIKSGDGDGPTPRAARPGEEVDVAQAAA